MAQLTPAPVSQAAKGAAAPLSAPPPAASPGAEVSKKGTAVLQAVATNGPAVPVAERKPVELTDDVKKAIEKLEQHKEELTAEIQQCFQAIQDRLIERIAGRHAVLTFHNQQFLAEKGRLEDPNVREKWRLLREKEARKVEECQVNFVALQEVFNQRIAILRKTIQDHQIEGAILKEIMVGKTSWSMAALKQSLSYYGVLHRLDESKTELESRKTKLGIKVGEARPSVALPTDPQSASLTGKLSDISQNLACLLEQAAVVDETLRRSVLETAKLSAWPKRFYDYLNGELNTWSVAMATLKPDVEARLKALSADMKGKAEQDKRTMKREQAELTKQWESIQANEREIRKILDYFKKTFALPNEAESSGFADFSPVYKDAINLLTLIASHRERVVNEGAWELFFESHDQRKVSYYKQVDKTAAYEAQRKALMDTQVAPRQKLLEAAVPTYQGYIDTMQAAITCAAGHLKDLTSAAQLRAKWKVEPPVDKVKKEDTSPKKDEPAPVLAVAGAGSAAAEKK